MNEFMSNGIDLPALETILFGQFSFNETKRAEFISVIMSWFMIE